MPLKIQRIARGLGELLSTFGGQTPAELEDRTRGTVDLTQFYGGQQRQVLSAGAGGVAQSLSAPQANVVLSTNGWSVLFTAQALINGVTAATTQVGWGVFLTRANAGGSTLIAVENVQAPVVGSNLEVSFVAPYPMILPPGSSVGVLMFSSIGAATQTVGITVDFGLLG
jgi:hypothetical protein